MATKIYSYGCLPPIENVDLVTEQFSLAHRYHNTLVAIERHRRESMVKKRLELFPTYDKVVKQIEAINLQIDELRSRMKQRNAVSQKRNANSDLKNQIAEFKKSLVPLRVEEKAIRSQINGKWDGATKSWITPPDPEWTRAREQIFREAAAARKAAYGSKEFEALGWGTKLIIDQQVPIKDGGDMPRFKRWTGGEGRLAVQIQSTKPLHSSDIFGDDSRLRVHPFSDQGVPLEMRINANGKPINKWKRKAVAWMRVASNGRTPIWAKFPVRYHRHLADGQIKWAWVLRRKTGTRFRWWFQFTLQLDEHREPWLDKEGSVGIDLGWRLVERGLRIAYWVGSDGLKGQVVIPHARLQRWDEVKEIQSERDGEFNIIKAVLVQWIGTSGLEFPEWFTKELETLPLWKSCERLCRFVERWRGERFPADSEMFERMSNWAERDRKEFDRERHIERKTNNWRENMFKCLLKELGYRTAFIEDTNWAELQEKPSPETDPNNNVSIRYRKVASVGRFASLASQYMNVVRVCAEHTTSDCHACGHRSNFDHLELVHTCPACGLKIDQDERAARNLLQTGLALQAQTATV